MLVSSVKDYAIFMLDTKGCVATWNSGAQRIKGYTAEEIIGKPIDIFYTQEELQRKEPEINLAMALQNGHFETEGWRVKKDGATFYANIVFTALVDSEGKFYGYAKVTRDITEKRKAEERIRFLATIAENIQDPVIVSDTNFCTTSWNKAAEKLLEWKSEEVIGKAPLEFLKIIYPHNSREQILQSFKENGYWQGEAIYHTKSGKPLNILATASQLKDANENVTGILVLAKDITERRKAEKQLEEFEHFFNNNNDLCGIANAVGYFETINTNFCKVLGYSEKEFCETPFIELVHPDDVARTLHEYEKLKSGELTINFINRYRKKDGNYLYLDWNATPNPLTGKLYCVARNITDRKIVESSLKESEEQIQTIFRNAPDAVVVIDDDGIIIRWNPRAEVIFGWQADEVIGKPLHETIIPQQFREAHVKGMRHFLKTGEGPVLNKQLELPALRKDNTTFDAGLSISPTLTKGKHVFIGFISDITDRKKAEHALNKLNAELEQRVKERTEEVIKTEKRFRALIENNHDIISLMDESFKIIYRSPSAARITGWTDEDLKYVDGARNVHPDDLAKAKEEIEDLMVNPGKSLHVSFRNKHKNGHYLWVEGTVVNLLHDEGVKAIVFNFRDVTERKKLEDLLHKVNVLAHIGGWEVDVIKGTVYWSDITRELHEAERDYVPDLATGINFYKAGAGRELIAQKVKEAIELGKPWDEELQIVTAKNNERWIRTIGETEFVNGKCIRIYGSFQDIDQRKKVEQALLHSEARARRIFESDMIGFIFWSEQGQILEANDYFLKMTGYNREDLEKGLVNWAAMTPPEYANLDTIALEQIAGTGICKPFEKEYIRKDGSRFPIVLGAAALGANFDGVGVCYVMDITERIKAAETIKETLKEKDIILESIGDAFFAVDKYWTVTYWNRIAEIALSVRKQEILGKNLWDIFSQSVDSESYRKYHQAIATNEVVHFEDHYPTLNKWYEISAYPSENGLSVYFKDVTERKKAEEEIRQLNTSLEEKVVLRTEELQNVNKELEAFSYSVSHDLRAPLRAVNGYARMLIEDYGTELGAEANRVMTNIVTNALKMSQLIDGLLSFSRLGRKELQKSNVLMSNMVTEVCRELEEMENQRIVDYRIGNMLSAQADNMLIKQVWINLISNALKYSKQKEKSIIEIGSESSGAEIIYHVKDNGAGFDMRYADKLFGVFQRLHSDEQFEGTGVGLAIVQRIVSKHGGRVWAEGKINEGATFYFSLPLKL